MDRAFRKGHLEIDFPAREFGSVTELLLRATRLFFSTLPFLAAITLMVYLPGKLALQFALYVLDVPSEGIAAYGLMGFCDLVLSALVVPAIVYGLVARLRTGKTPPVADALRWGRRQWGKTLWNQIKVEITVALWSLFLVVPGVVAMIKLIFTEVIVAIEGDREREVLQRSRDLSEGHRWRIFVALLPALPLSLVHTFATLRTLQDAPLAWVPVDGLFAVLDQWMNVLILLIYLGLTVPLQRAVGKRKAA
ncbi:MAG TPA: hypothetical protein VGZ73_07135 [Bryobacteraceae bacterium]|jgi:hypothetical protein|nr:hypothetical protein [Bryobacteraceae bacterium]